MSNNGQRQLYQNRISKSQRRPVSPNHHSTQHSMFAQRSFMPPHSGASQAPGQPLRHLKGSHASHGSSIRSFDPPSLAYSRENNDRALSYVYGYDLSDRYRRPQSRLPQSSAGYRDMPYVMSQDMPTGARQNMSISEASSGPLNAAPYRDFPADNAAPKPLLSTRIPRSSSRAAAFQSEADVAATAPPALQLKFRRVSEALREAAILWPARPSELTADHAIQAFAYFYGLFLPLPQIPYLELTDADKYQAARLKDGIDAVDSLLRDLEYSDRRVVVAEMGTLGLSKQPYRTVSATYWLMELAQAARLSVPQDDQDEVPYFDQSLEYAEYAVRMIFASSLSTAPDVTVPEAHTYVDAALSRFRIEKEEAIAKCRSEIYSIEEERAEETKALEEETAKLAELEAKRSEKEALKHDMEAKLASAKLTFSSLEAELNARIDERRLARGDFEALRDKLTASGIESPQKAIELAARLQAQQMNLEKLDSELQGATAKLNSEQKEQAEILLREVINMASAYNEDTPEGVRFPRISENVDDILGKAASDFFSAQTMLAVSERWKHDTKKSEHRVGQLERTTHDVEAEIADLETANSSVTMSLAILRAALEQLLNENAILERESRQLEHQLRLRDERIGDHTSPRAIVSKRDMLSDATSQLNAAEAKNAALESQMRECADRKREIRVLLETYKAAYARIIEGIGQQESVIRQQEQTVKSLQRVLSEFAPEGAKSTTS